MSSTRNKATAGARYHQVDAEHAGQRLDNFLLTLLKGVPRSHVYRLIRSGQVRVNSGRIAPSYRLRAADRIRVPPVAQGGAKAAPRPDRVDWLAERIIYEDDRILVLDKPAGIAVHGGSGVGFGCIEALRSLRPRVQSLELAHRLDRATSGCLVVAKRRSALRALHRLLREGAVEKRYLALVAGDWQLGRLEVDVGLSAVRRGGETQVEADPSGKPARSVFRLVERFSRFASLVEVVLLTGRTHQIRVHAAHVGHPIAGDPRYGDEAFNRQMQGFGLGRMFLHAHSLGFAWPDGGREVDVAAPLPAELAGVLQALTAP